MSDDNAGFGDLAGLGVPFSHMPRTKPRKAEPATKEELERLRSAMAEPKQELDGVDKAIMSERPLEILTPLRVRRREEAIRRLAQLDEQAREEVRAQRQPAGYAEGTSEEEQALFMERMEAEEDQRERAEAFARLEEEEWL